MAALTLQQMTSAGLSPTFVAASGGGDTVSPTSSIDDRCYLRVKNASGSSVTVTLTDPGLTAAGNAGTNPTFTVPATTGDVSMPLHPGLINTSTGQIAVSYSATTSLTVAFIRR